MPELTIKHNVITQSVTHIHQDAILPTSVESDNSLDKQALAQLKHSATAFAKSLNNQTVAAELPQEIREAIGDFINHGLNAVESLGQLSIQPLSKFLAFCARLSERATQETATTRQWRSFEAALKAMLAAGNEVVRRATAREIQKRTVSFSLLGTSEDLGRFGPELRQAIREAVEAKQIELAEKYGWQVIKDQSGKLLRLVAPAGHLLQPVLPIPNLDDPQVCMMLIRNLSKNVDVDGHADESENSQED